MFSCCCARVDFSWSPVCDCYAGGYRCEQTCLETALVEDSVYASVGTNLYNNVTYMYPKANIWLTGHSVSLRQPQQHQLLAHPWESPPLLPRPHLSTSTPNPIPYTAPHPAPR